MSLGGTSSYATAPGIPPLVSAAVQRAKELDFESSCRVEQGRLLAALASGATERIGETGTGCGVGLAWMLSTRRSDDVEIVSVEVDPTRAEAARALFADIPNITVLTADWSALTEHGPFDLLVLDGGGHGKWGDPIDVATVLAPGGVVVVDDLQPADSWPPNYQGSPDSARLHWLQHRDLTATEIRLAPDLAAVVGTRRFESR